MANSAARFLYVGIKPCGCVVALAAIDPRWTKDTARYVAGWIRDGLAVERVPVGDERCQLRRCTCVPKGKS